MTSASDALLVRKKKPLLVWVAFVVCTVLGLWQAGVLAVILHNKPSFIEFPLWKYYLVFTPVLIRILSGISFVFLWKSTVPLSIAMLVTVVALPFFTPLILGNPNPGFFALLRSFPVLTFIDWALLLAVVYFAIDLKRKGVLK